MTEEGLKRARYSEVERRLWNDGRFRSLSPVPPCGQGLWLYLLTTPELGVLPGLIVMGESAMAEHLKWPLKGFREAFAEVFAKGMVEADWEARLVVIPKAIGKQKPQSPNVVVSWRQHWLEVPDCALKSKYYRALKAYVEALPEGFRQAFAKAVSDPSSKQEQEQEQEQEELILPGTMDPELDAFDHPSGTRIRAARSDVGPLELNDDERAVHAAITGDPSLRAIVQRPGRLARDLVEIAPGINVATEVRRAGAWLRANPKKRKSNGARFLLAWLTKAQEERGGRSQFQRPGIRNGASRATQPSPPEDFIPAKVIE